MLPSGLKTVRNSLKSVRARLPKLSARYTGRDRDVRAEITSLVSPITCLPPNPCLVLLARDVLLLQTAAASTIKRGSGQGDYQNTASFAKRFPRATKARGDER